MGTHGDMKCAWLTIPPPGYHEHFRLYWQQKFSNHGDDSQPAALVSAKRIENLLIDDIEQIRRWAVRYSLPCSNF